MEKVIITFFFLTGECFGILYPKGYYNVFTILGLRDVNICWANVVPTPIIMYLVYCMTGKYMLGQCCPNANSNAGLRAEGLPAEAVKHE